MGGCCGTGPEHIRRMAVSIRAIHPVPTQVSSLGTEGVPGAVGNRDPPRRPISAWEESSPEGNAS